MLPRHSYKMGIIGNGACIAYIERNTNIAWLCWPRFDSSFVFGGLLDRDKGGVFTILPVEPIIHNAQYYIENTNILCTEITTRDGKYRIIDFTPRFKIDYRYYNPLLLIRKIEVISGNPKVKIDLDPKYDYGESALVLEKSDEGLFFKIKNDKLYLKTDIPLNCISEKNNTFTLRDNHFIALSWGNAEFNSIEDELRKTKQYWWYWVATCALPDIYQKEAIRSCLALKLHQYEETGAIIAAGSTSLPETPGAGRNWDYRYFWVRDSYYTLEVARKIGHFEELSKYANFIRNTITHRRSGIQPLYSIYGEEKLEEKILPLAGYNNEKPVRIGNAAYTQKQHDAYGQIILSIAPLYLDQRISPEKRLDDVELIDYLLDCIEKHVGQADAGIWELRHSQDMHVYSALFHWLGAVTALKIGQHLKHRKMITKAKAIIHKCANCIELCYSPELDCYMGNALQDKIDATTLELINMGYITERRIIEKQISLIEKHLIRGEHELLMRYSYRDDFGEQHIAFIICNFWYISALAKIGRINKALQTFEKLLSSANHLGLLSEDVEFDDLGQYGNFVQSYSHVGLVNAVFDLDFAMKHYSRR
ncbi:MAG: glycoside hydrolase family 15 protein [Pseudomonadota bacterium]